MSGPSTPPGTPGQPPLPPPGPPAPPRFPPAPPMPPVPGPGGPGPGAPQGKRKRDPLPFIIAGVVVAVVAAICCLGGALVLFDRRTHPDPSRTPVPPPPASGEPQPSPGSSGSEGGGTPLTGAACLVGVWRETSHTSTVQIDGSPVQMKGSGAIQRFTADGTAVLDLSAGVTEIGKRAGSTYQLVSKGTITFHYRAEPGVVFYSDPVAKGTAVWKRNGKQFDKQPLTGGIDPEFFSCTGDKLTQNANDYAIELERVTG